MIKKNKVIVLVKVVLMVVFLLLVSCGNDYIPKPSAQLRLDYPRAQYVKANLDLPFEFETNALVQNIEMNKVVSSTKSYGVNLEYPSMKGTIFLTYKGIEGSEKNLRDFLRDAQNFTQKHTVKADGILEERYENDKNRVYGMFYEVDGNAASQSQFYVTDSVNHFLTGSLYFNARPNYDSILPAAHYLQNDIKHIMETVKWK